ncbi:MAG: hydantoinase/oxoprolinase family protein [Pseudomonadota bacterium]
MPYRLGVDVGGTFTDVLLVDDHNGATHTAKVPSTPDDSSIGVLNGITRACEQAAIDPASITQVMHGTTVATNTVLTGTGAKVGLVTTRGYRQVLHIARSFVPGGLGAWVIYNKSAPMAPLELTIEAHERMSAKGEVVTPLGEAEIEAALNGLKDQGIESLTVSLINAYANDAHEQQIKAIAEKLMPEVPVSISSEVIPEMQEYERTVTTVANSYVRPRVENYIRNLTRELGEKMPEVKLSILRSDGGLSSADAAASYPVNLLMSGPAGGVAGAAWIAAKAGFKNLLTLDMGGTSTDVALVEDSKAQLRRETTVGDVTVRASSIDVRTVGAGGGSIAHVPELTKALRVGPQSAGAEPGPAAYQKGGREPTVTDANVVLGYLPATAMLGGDMAIDAAAANTAVATIGEALGLPPEDAAEGIYNIVNENMFGALRLVSVEKGYDPRDFALIAFGGAGALHANALAKLMHAWPVIVPPGPGVLCALGDATTRLRNESSRTLVARFEETDAARLKKILLELGQVASESLIADGVAQTDLEINYQVDVRYRGQGLSLPIDVDGSELDNIIEAIGEKFDQLHEQLFTFALEEEKETVNLRATVQQSAQPIALNASSKGGNKENAELGSHRIYYEKKWHQAMIYDRDKLGAGDVINGPAVVTEMDATTLILPEHAATVDDWGNLLIQPMEA